VAQSVERAEQSDQQHYPQNMKWYYVENGQQAGPVEETDFPPLMRTGKLRADTLVWREGLANWEPFSKACPNEFAASGAPIIGSGAEAVCAECGGIFDKNNMIPHGPAYICAKCKPVFMQKLSEGVAIKTGDLRYAGFWIRLLAKFVDGLILGIPLFGLMIVIGIMMARGSGSGAGPDLLMNLVGTLAQLIFYGLSVLYSIFFVGKYGATPGKMVCKIHIVTATGEKVTYGRATGRAFAELLSGLVCNIGYLIAAFDKEKRALHDHICNTRVVYK
jgi:uncharacterized RDD family membrane protein YckC